MYRLGDVKGEAFTFPEAGDMTSRDSELQPRLALSSFLSSLFAFAHTTQLICCHVAICTNLQLADLMNNYGKLHSLFYLVYAQDEQQRRILQF